MAPAAAALDAGEEGDGLGEEAAAPRTGETAPTPRVPAGAAAAGGWTGGSRGQGTEELPAPDPGQMRAAPEAGVAAAAGAEGREGKEERRRGSGGRQPAWRRRRRRWQLEEEEKAS